MDIFREKSLMIQSGVACLYTWEMMTRMIVYSIDWNNYYKFKETQILDGVLFVHQPTKRWCSATRSVMII